MQVTLSIESLFLLRIHVYQIVVLLFFLNGQRRCLFFHILTYIASRTSRQQSEIYARLV